MFPAAFLANLEEDLDEPIGSYFDLISGTSTGGIIAIGLALGLSAKDILKIYEEEGPAIFAQTATGLKGWLLRHFHTCKWAVWGPKYSSDPLHKALTNVFGEKRLGEAKTRLMIPAWHPKTQDVYIFKTAHHERLQTDYKELPQYSQVSEDWPQSNPMGYAAWFRNRMIVQLMERKQYMVDRGLTVDSVEEIPDYKVRTPLQRAVQLLKRHRDCMFADDPEHKPISIIITTLAAHAYNNEDSISLALGSILKGMDQHIEQRGDIAWVANPVNPTENFADKWPEEPKKRENFFKWLECVRNDFALYLRANSFNEMPDSLKENLGSDLVDTVFRTLLGVASTVSVATKASTTPISTKRAEAIKDEILDTGTASKPWRSC